MTAAASAGDSTGLMPGRLVVLTGPSGVGKGTVVAELRRLRPDLWVSVSATTRAPRAGEVDGAALPLLDRASSSTRGGRRRRAAGVGASSPATGTARRARRSSAGWPPGESVLLEIELQGARQVRAAMPEALLVFLTPPSLADAGGPAARPGHRGRGGDRAPAGRARATSWPPPGSSTCVVVNDDVARAARELVDCLEDPGRPA